MSILENSPLTANLKSFGITAASLTGGLFTIDEGQISLFWMASPAHWFVFAIYAAVIFSSQVVVHQIAAHLLANHPRPLLSLVLGSGLGLIVMWQMLES